MSNKPISKPEYEGIVPEVGGEEATNLADLFFEENDVWIDDTEIDKYNRKIATVKTADGTSYDDIVKRCGLDKNSKSNYP